MARGSQVVWRTSLSVSPRAVVQEGILPPRSGALYPPHGPPETCVEACPSPAALLRAWQRGGGGASSVAVASAAHDDFDVDSFFPLRSVCAPEVERDLTPRVCEPPGCLMRVACCVSTFSFFAAPQCSPRFGPALSSSA